MITQIADVHNTHGCLLTALCAENCVYGRILNIEGTNHVQIVKRRVKMMKNLKGFNPTRHPADPSAHGGLSLSLQCSAYSLLRSPAPPPLADSRSLRLATLHASSCQALQFLAFSIMIKCAYGEFAVSGFTGFVSLSSVAGQFCCGHPCKLYSVL